MKTLRLNREFAMRHIGVALLMLGLSGWFAYDGYVAYPQHDDGWFEARHLRKEDATRRQKEFAVLALLASLAIAGHVAWVARLRFSFDDEAFECNGARRRFADIGEKDVDWSKWEKKGIVKVCGITLDAWHHEGVRDAASRLPLARAGGVVV